MRILVLCLLVLTPSFVQAGKRPTLKYAVVECSAWPWSGNTAAGVALRQLGNKITAGKLRAVFKVLVKGIRAAVEARLIGTAAGTKVWSVRGPKVLGAALTAAGCTVVQYKNVLALPAAKRDWIKVRSTCVGEATKNGRTLSVWPCGVPGVVEVRVDGIAPRVMHGDSVYNVSGVVTP